MLSNISLSRFIGPRNRSRPSCASGPTVAPCERFGLTSRPEAPERFVLSLGRRFTVEPNLFEQVQTDFRELATLSAGDLLVHDAQQFLVVAPAKDRPPLVVDLAGGQVTELSATSVAVITHWNIYVRNADGQRICLVDTKSHRQAAAPVASEFALRARR